MRASLTNFPAFALACGKVSFGSGAVSDFGPQSGRFVGSDKSEAALSAQFQQRTGSVSLAAVAFPKAR